MVVSDTTALIILAKSNTLFLLSNIFKTIYIPNAVYNELIVKDDIVKYRIKNFDKLKIKKVNNLKILKNIKKLNLDKGEIEAISLAIELNTILIIDEKKGRKIALDKNLKITGILGILIENYKQKFLTLEEVKLYFYTFKNHGYRISEKLEDIFFKRLKSIDK